MKHKETKIDFAKREIKIQKVKPGSKVLARARIKFDKRLKIEGFTLVESKDGGLFLSPPTFGSRYHKIFFLEDEKLWKEIEAEVIKKFEEKDIEEYCEKENISDIEL